MTDLGLLTLPRRRVISRDLGLLTLGRLYGRQAARTRSRIRRCHRPQARAKALKLRS